MERKPRQDDENATAEEVPSGESNSQERSSGPADARVIDRDRHDLPGARTVLHALHSEPFGGRDKQCLSTRTAEHAGECTAIDLDPVEDLAAFANADATFIGNVGIPDGPRLIETDAVGRSFQS